MMTRNEQIFFERTMPGIQKALEGIEKQTELQNTMKALEMAGTLSLNANEINKLQSRAKELLFNK